MNVINHRKFQTQTGGPSKGVRQLLTISAAVIGLFILANIIVGLLYANKTFPSQTVGGRTVGSASYADVERLVKEYSLPQSVVLIKDSRKESVPTAQFDARVDVSKTMEQVRAKPLLPLLALFEKQHTPLIIDASNTVVADKILILDAAFSKAATDKRVAFNGSDFIVEDAKGGYTFDADATARAVLSALAQGKKDVAAVTQATPAGNNSGDFTKERDELRKKLASSVTYVSGTQSVTTTKKDIGNFYEHSGRTMTLSDSAIAAFITSKAAMSAQPLNVSDAVLATKHAINTMQKITFVLSKPNARVMTYCAIADKVPQSELGGLIGTLAVAYGDPRGWNNKGSIAFKYVQSGCDYKVVLAAPSEMTAYGAICDDYYNCQVGSNVIVNNDRWLQATVPWNKTGQSLETYRLLIINHETGHRLGLRDYNVCSGAGQPAPVMMQQSIDLMGCSFNVWPLQSELDRL